MKKFTVYSLLGLFALAVVAWAAPEKIQSDILMFGRKASVADKVLEIEQNAGANNPKITSDATDLDFQFFAKLFTLGRGLAENVRLIVNRGGSNPELRWNESTSKWEFSNDGSSYEAISAGGGAGGGGVVLNENPGFEDGSANWTASGGTFTTTTTAANVGFEITAGSWDASAASQTLSNALVTVPAGLFGKVCSLSWYYKGGDSNLKAQVYDGTNVIAESSAFTAQANYSAKQVIYFTCPSSGQIQARFIASANAAIVYLDDVKLGQEVLFDVYENMPSWSGKHEGDCLWTVSSATYADPSSDGSCTFTERFSDGFGAVASRGSKTPGIAFAAPASGVLQICSSAQQETSAAVYQVTRLYDGTAELGETSLYQTSVQSNPIKVCGLKSVTKGDAVTIDRQWKLPGGGSSTIQKAGPGVDSVVDWVVNYVKISDGAAKAITVEQTGWRVDASLGGANPSLGGSSVSSYTEITNASLDLVLASGSASAEVPCSGTNPSTGLTCSAGDESLGISFTPPTSGIYEVCAQISHVTDTTGTANATFQWVKTPNNAQTILAEGGGKMASGTSNSAAGAFPQNNCGTFVLSDTSKATFRLMYEQTIGGGAPTLNYVWMDRASGQGQIETKISVRRRVEYADVIKLTTPVTDFVAYTPTFTNFGTESNVNFEWRCTAKNTMAIRGRASFAAGGVAAAGQISLPSGATAGATYTTQRMVGVAGYESADVGNVYVPNILAGNSYFNISTQGVAGGGIAGILNGDTMSGTTWQFNLYELSVNGACN